MFKCWVLVVLLCHEIYQISGHAPSKSSDTSFPSLPLRPVENHNENPVGQYNYTSTRGRLTNLENVGKKIRPDYTISIGIGAHKVHRRRLSWNAARQTCIQEGAHLADVRTIEEAEAIKTLMLKNSVPYAWVGFHDLFESGDWVTVLDEPITAMEWDPWPKVPPYDKVPDNVGGNEHCTEFLTNLVGLNDLDCRLLYPFVCKINL